MSIVQRTRTPGDLLVLRPQTGHENEFQSPSRAGTASSHRLKTAASQALRDRPRSGGERDGLERERSERSDHFSLLPGENSQVLRFADLDTEERVTETTKEVAKDVHDSDYPVDSPLKGPRSKEARLKEKLSSSVLFDLVKQARKKELLERQAADHVKDTARGERLKELAGRRASAYWESKKEDEEEERKILEVQEERRRLKREEEQRLAQEKAKELQERAKELAFFQNLLESVRRKVKAVQETNEDHGADKETTLQSSASLVQIVEGSITVEGLQLETLQDRQRFPTDFKNAIAEKMEVDESRVRVTHVEATNSDASTVVVEFDVNTAAETPRQQGILKTPKTTAEAPQQGILKTPRPPREDAPQSSKKPAVTVTPRQSSSCKSEAVTPRQSEAGSGSRVIASDSCTSEAVTQRQSSSAATPRQSAAAAPRQISSKHASPQRRQEDASKPSQKPEKNSASFVSNVPLFPIIVSQKNRKLVRLEALKDLVQSKFTSVYDAFVFFDFMKVNYVSMKNLMRGLVKLGADDLVNDFASLVRDLEWKCQDHGMIHCGEFFQLLAWHPLNDFIKELAAARLAYDRKKRAEQNKSISIKVPREQKPTPLCDKLREVLKTKYRSVAGFMVVANMDVKDVISFLELNTAFRLEGIEGIDIEALATELSDPSFPPTAIKTFSFQNSLRWHSLEEVEAMITEERLSFFVERNQLEKGLPQIPLPPTAVPFFREHPEVDKAKSIMQKHFENAADAFVWFDTDNSGEITRVKMAHGLQRLQNMEGGDITLDIDKLMPELQNLRFTGGCIDAVGFIWNFRWHEKFPDIAEAVLIARRKKMEKAAMIEPQKKGRGGKFGFKIKNQNKLLYTVTRNQGKELPVILGGTVSMDEWLRKKELNVTLSKIASIRLSVEPKKGVSDVSDDLQEPTVITLTGGNSRNLEHAAVKRGSSDEKGNVQDNIETGEAQGFAREQVGLDGPTRSRKLADVANLYDRQLHHGRHRRLKFNTSVAHLPAHQATPRTHMSALKMALQERGFKDSIDAFCFFDVEQKESITRGDLQKGLVALRIFTVTAKSVPFPKMGVEGIDRMDLLQFLVLCGWDDSLNVILAMERSEVAARMQDSYNRRQEITRTALEEAAKITDKSNADLKAQVLQGLTDLPDLFHLPTRVLDCNRQGRPREYGNQTDRRHARADNGYKANGTGDGSQTERGKKHMTKRCPNVQFIERQHKQIELKSEVVKVFGEPERSGPFHSGVSPRLEVAKDDIQHKTQQNDLGHKIHASAKTSSAKHQLIGNGANARQAVAGMQGSIPQFTNTVRALEEDQDPPDERNIPEEERDNPNWDVLDGDPQNKVPDDPRAALLAEKFMTDRVMRVETKQYIYEGQVNIKGKPHGQGIKFFSSSAPAAQQSDNDTSTSALNHRRKTAMLAPPPSILEGPGHDHWQVGRFSEGKMIGSGMMRMPDGSYYFGDFKEGKRHGAGINISEHGVIFEGEFFNNMRDGCGCMWGPSGPVYFGEWHLDQRHGSGVIGNSNSSFLENAEDKNTSLLPNSVIRSAIQFESFVVTSKNHVRGCTNKMMRADHDAVVEAILWNSTQSRTSACEGWNVGMSCIGRMLEFVKSVDVSLVPKVSELQLAQRFTDKSFYQIPKIPLWVLAQSAIVSLETETDAGAATKGSPSGSPRSKASSAGRSPLPRSKSKITAVRIAQRERFFQ